MSEPRLKPTIPRAGPNLRRAYRELNRTQVALQDKTAAGGVARTDQIRLVYGDFSVRETDFTVGVRNTAAIRTGQLPSVKHTVGRRIRIQDESGNASVNKITLVPVGAQTIDGVATRDIDTNYGSVTLRSTPAGWVSETE